jgi:hypothetical protein
MLPFALEKVLHFQDILLPEIYFSVGRLSFIVFIHHKILHLVADQLDVWYARQKALEILVSNQSMLPYHAIHDALHVTVDH